jgi:hypothetical protein
MKALDKRLADLETQQQPDHHCIVMTLGGGEWSPEHTTGIISGVGHLHPLDGETRNQFHERVCASSWARRPLEDLTPERRAEAMAQGKERARKMKTILIGGDDQP